MASNGKESIAHPRELLVSWLARLYRHRLTTTTGGNLSLVDDDGAVYITPSGGDKAIVPPERISVRPKGQDKFQGPAPPSMEWPLHTGVYEVRPNDCKAVVHAHSQTLVAFSLAKPVNGSDPRLPDTRVLLGAFQACGKVALAPYALPGSQELANGCRKAFEEGADCVILENHGVVTIGASLRQAYDRFVSLEYLARSIVNAVPLEVEPKPLPEHILRSAVRTQKRSSAAGPLPKPIESAPGSNGVTMRVISGTEKELRGKLCGFVHRAYSQDLVTSSSGSFSVRLKTEEESKEADAISFLITPTDVDRHTLEPSDLCFVSNNPKLLIECHGEEEEPPAKAARHDHLQQKFLFHPIHAHDDPEEVHPSRAAAVHGTIFATHPEVNVIMVVQPPFATSYCVTGLPFDSAGIPESHIILHAVQSLPVEAVLEDNGIALAKALDPKSGKNTILVQGYGLITVGEDLLKTFVQVEVCESMCGVTLTALRRGPVNLLSEAQVKEIDKAFSAH